MFPSSVYNPNISFQISIRRSVYKVRAFSIIERKIFILSELWFYVDFYRCRVFSFYWIINASLLKFLHISFQSRRSVFDLNLRKKNTDFRSFPHIILGLKNAQLAITNNTRLIFFLIENSILDINNLIFRVRNGYRDVHERFKSPQKQLHLTSYYVMIIKTLNVHFFLKFHLRKDSRATQGRKSLLGC